MLLLISIRQSVDTRLQFLYEMMLVLEMTVSLGKLKAPDSQAQVTCCSSDFSL